MSWQELMALEDQAAEFLIEPYIPKGGIIFLWGETSIGKSPITWQMAAAVARGWGFYGLPVEKGNVLYIELDTPRDLIKSRIKLIKDPPEEGLDFLFLPPLSAPHVHPDDSSLLESAAEKGYDLVVINTLRKCHSLNDKEPQTVKVVYEYFQRLFPGAALLFVHHSKKTTFDSQGEISGKSRESFSGAQNWLNDAQVGLQLLHRKTGEGDSMTSLELRHEKTQVSRQYRALTLNLDGDGTNFNCPRAEEMKRVYDLVHEGTFEGEKLASYVAAELNVSRATAFRRLHAVTSGAFPGVWLDPKD